VNTGILTASYIVASILFILSLGGLSQQETARRGNLYGMIGMALAVTVTAIAHVHNYPLLAAAVVPAAIIGAVVAARVAMTAMPQLVALLHSFVGLAAVLVGISGHLHPTGHLEGAAAAIHSVEIYLGIFIGAITFTGSVVAFGKLQGSISSKPLTIPGRHMVNAIGVLACIWFGIDYVGDPTDLQPLLIMAGIAGFIGWHLVMAIGGADMPVVVSMLN